MLNKPKKENKIPKGPILINWHSLILLKNTRDFSVSLKYRMKLIQLFSRKIRTTMK